MKYNYESTVKQKILQIKEKYELINSEWLKV